jgi:hypothetical protein
MDSFYFIIKFTYSQCEKKQANYLVVYLNNSTIHVPRPSIKTEGKQKPYVFQLDISPFFILKHENVEY